MVAIAGQARTAADRTSGRLSMPTTDSRRPADGRERDQGDRDVGTARPDIEQGQLGPMRGERIDGGGGQARTAQPVVDPPEVPQVPRQRGRIVEWTIEQLDGIGAAVHPRQRTPRLRWRA